MPHTIWSTQPIFLSSTFSDMNAERDVLGKFVFPKLQEMIYHRRVRLEPIDYRWGIYTGSQKEKEQKELRILKVCLEDIDRSHPFFIGLIGDRYGWVPPEKRMKDAENEKGFVSKLKNKSVTALEIEYGVLASKEQLKRSFFFFREPLPYDEMPAEVKALYYEENPELQKRLKELKEEIIKSVGEERVFTYKADWIDNKVSGLGDFRKLVEEVLWDALDKEPKFAEVSRPQTWKEEEQRYLQDFVEDRAFSFSGREDVIDELKKFALGEAGYDNWGKCITGESGSGKSALIAKLYRELEKEDVILLARAAGISLRSNSLQNMLTGWIKELAEKLNVDESEQLEDRPKSEMERLQERTSLDGEKSKERSKFEDLKNLFASLLSQAAASKRVVVLVDALNQFERTEQAKYVNWLPGLIPENSKIIFTAIPGEETEHLSKRNGVSLKALKGIKEEDARKIIKALCKLKELEPEAIEIILKKKIDEKTFSYSNPLWLTMVIDDFLQMDEDDFGRMKGLEGDAEEKLTQLLIWSANRIPPDVEGMYGYVFERCDVFGKDFVNSILKYIGISRNGLRESDLEDLITKLKWDNLNFASFRRYLRSHIVQKGEFGLWDFRHVKARESLKKSLLMDEKTVIALHKSLSAHLDKLNEEDPLRLSEIIWHLFKCDDKKRAAEVYGSNNWNHSTTNEYSKTLCDILVELENNIEWVCLFITLPGITDSVKRTIINNVHFNLDDKLNEFIPLNFHLKLAKTVLAASVELRKQYPNIAEYERQLSVSYNKVGNIYEALVDTKTALENYENSLKIREELDKRNPDSVQYSRDLYVSYGKMGNIYKSQGMTNSALENYERSFKIAQQLCTLYKDSDEYTMDLSVAYYSIGNIHKALGDTKTALKNYKCSLKIRKELQNRHPDSAQYAWDLSASYICIADIRTALGDTKSALDYNKISLNIRKELWKGSPDSTRYARGLSVSYCKIGEIYSALGETKTALENYESSHCILLELRKRNPDSAKYEGDLSVSYNKIGDIYKTLGDSKRSLENYENSLKITEELRKRNPDLIEYTRDLSISYDRIGDIYEAIGDTENSLKNYERSLKISKELFEQHSDLAEYARDLSVSYLKIGDIHLNLGDTKTALTNYEISLKICLELWKRDPKSADYKRNLSVLYFKIGEIYCVLEDTKTALANYEKSRKMCLGLRELNQESAEYLRDLSILNQRIGDVHAATGETRIALESYENSLKNAEELRKRNPSSDEYARGLGISYGKVGDIYKALGDKKTALINYESAQILFLELWNHNPESSQHAKDLSISYDTLGDLYKSLGDTKTALECYKNSLKLWKEIVKRNPGSVECARDLSYSYFKVGDVYTVLNNSEKALENYESSLKISEDLSKQIPVSPLYTMDLYVLYRIVGATYIDLNDTKSALESYEKFSKIAEELIKRNPNSVEYLNDLSASFNKIGDIHKALGNLKRAHEYYERSLKIRKEMRNRFQI